MVAGMKNGEMRRGPPSSRRRMLALDDVESTDAGAYENPGTIRDFRGHSRPDILHRKAGGRQGKLNKAAHLLQFFFFDEPGRIKALDLSGEGGGKAGGIKMGDGACPLLPREQILPGFLGTDTNRLTKPTPVMTTLRAKKLLLLASDLLAQFLQGLA